MTAFDYITAALKLVGVLADGELPTDDTANQGLVVFNGMIDAWNAERQAIFTTRIDDFPYVLGQQVYTLGTGGDFNIPRPARIDAGSTIVLTDPTNPVEIPIDLYSVSDWQTQVPVKKVTGNFPLLFYPDGGFPLNTLSFWPIPTNEPCSFRLYSWQGLGAQTLTSAVSFPPGYDEAFRYNLAARIGAEFNAPPSSLVIALAQQGLARIKNINAPDLNLRSDLVPNNTEYNYRADLFGIGW